MTNDFSGFNGFIWFKGVVENRQDPLKLGRVQVRIVGLHSEQKTLIPTDALPWATIVLPVNGARTLSVPKEGEWVFGFFEDGKNSQRPVILGIEPGIVPPKLTNVNSQLGFLDPRTQAEVDAAPKLPAGQIADVSGEPTTPPTAREKVANTAIDVANNNRDHVCDIRQYITLGTSTSSVSFNGVLNKIRDAIRKALAALGLDPSGTVSYIVSFLKSVAREVKRIAKIIKDNLFDLNRIVSVISKIKEMIQYILSLPAKLLAMLNGCLTALLSSITDAIKNVKLADVDGLTDTEDFNEIVASVNETIDASKDLALSAQEVLVIPSEIATQALGTVDEIQQAITTYSPTTESVVSVNTFSNSNVKLP